MTDYPTAEELDRIKLTVGASIKNLEYIYKGVGVTEKRRTCQAIEGVRENLKDLLRLIA